MLGLCSAKLCSVSRTVQTSVRFRTNLHDRFAGRTVIVRNGMVEEAFRAVNKILGSEGLFDLWRRTRYYEKPFNTRRRVNYEKCKAIYDEDMKRKIAFVMKKNKADAWVGR